MPLKGTLGIQFLPVVDFFSPILGKRIYPDGRAGEGKGLLVGHFKGNKMADSWAKDCCCVQVGGWDRPS
jgi:hypothetical protein